MQEMKNETPEKVEKKKSKSTKKGFQKIKEKFQRKSAKPAILRFNADPEIGLDSKQVAERMEQGLFNSFDYSNNTFSYNIYKRSHVEKGNNNRN